MRGSRTLTVLFPDPEENTSSGRGRSAELIEQRDRKMVARFYFYIRIKGLAFEVTIRQLVREFDLSERRIIDLLTEKADLVSQYVNQEPAISSLKEEYPFLRWA